MESRVPSSEKALRQRNATVQGWPAVVRPRRGYCSGPGTWHRLGDSSVQPAAACPTCRKLVVGKQMLAAVKAVEVPIGNLAERSLERENKGLLLVIALI